MHRSGGRIFDGDQLADSGAVRGCHGNACRRFRLRCSSGMNASRRPRRCLPVLLGLLLLLFMHAAAAAPAPDPWAPFDAPWFDRIDISAGLPHSTTTAIAQDSSGLIWIGTMGGLARYDGYRMQVYETATRATPGLPDAYVRNLLALPDGGMLIGTNAGGLVRFDPHDNSFHAYPVSANGTSDGKIYDLADDHAGGVWIASESGLNHLDLTSGQIRHIDTGKQAAPLNFSVLQDRVGDLWLGNRNGLFVRHAGTHVFVRADAGDPAIATVLENQVWALHEDRRGQLWVGSGQEGTVYRDAGGQWHGVPGYSGSTGQIRQSTVRDFLELASGDMWIATDGDGIIDYRAGATSARLIKHDPALTSSLPGSSIRALLQDRSGNIWAASELGVALTHPDARSAFSLLPSPLEKIALSEASVHGIYVDSHQRIWLGLGAGHIDMIDLADGSMHHLTLGGAQAQRDVQAFSEAADGSLWVGTQGLARIDPNTLKIEDSIIPALDAKPVLSLLQDGSTMLIGTYEGVYRYDQRTRTLEHFAHVASDPGSLSSDTVRQIARIGKTLWYGTTHGLSIANDAADNHGFVNLVHHQGDPTSLPQDYIGAITNAPDGQVWVSTYGGLAILDHHAAGQPYHFRTIGMAEGLASDKVSAMLDDDGGDLWLSLSNGIAKIDSDTLAVHNLGTRDGLHIISYIHTAAAKAPGGELLFGGLGGLTVIRPHWRPSIADDAALSITQAVLNGSPLPFAQLPGNGAKIQLKARSRNLRMDFALLDYESPMETSYSYRMDGLDDDWTEVPKGSAPTVIYTNLPHGDYRLQLRAITHGMQERTIQSELDVSVAPRWYETLLARIAAVLLLLGVIGLLVHMRTLYLRLQAKQLQLQIDDHTRDLRAANQRLDELAGTDGLTGVYNRRRFLELAGAERDLAAGRPICMALFDLDHFKQVNDTYGHLAGDAVIRTAVKVIRQHSRQGDLVGRYGGEEFVLCLPGTEATDAMATGARICQMLQSTSVMHDGRNIAVTISIGIAQLRDGESIEQWLARADKALYQAKDNGRNQCVLAA
jgi:diguanylate cyclase (GGDEF)-like protein